MQTHNWFRLISIKCIHFPFRSPPTKTIWKRFHFTDGIGTVINWRVRIGDKWGLSIALCLMAVSRQALVSCFVLLLDLPVAFRPYRVTSLALDLFLLRPPKWRLSIVHKLPTFVETKAADTRLVIYWLLIKRKSIVVLLIELTIFTLTGHASFALLNRRYFCFL